ncbi:uncharacterized protein YsxB (DUF464 family) [Peptoniphilus koenoeneniae]|uniref:Ribosomal processing cysteine protease Prp n=1 Tax=Peptoniphilus koenoeneniae TaxID=507751 RepID=A0ABU0AUA0_9FIRM|nr:MULTISPECIES: ribosomal-processing cysteine protease Prp [Peptoniphilus]ERT57235.1 PF04327 family protein [Peptoniphilus sp. BV3C26]MDQ0274858.1 uncharacterized protein YsxB (DUF464 family) [Peptoniphilus koenoeneniae]
MTEIVFFSSNNIFLGFEAKGHAYADNDSEEIVCAGISALTQTFYFSLLELLNFDESDIYDKQTDGYLMIRVNRKLADNEKVQLLFNSLKLGLDLIRMQFSENLKIEIQEVQND